MPDENGEPTYRTFNGPITIERNGRWRAGQPIARFRGDLWKTTGGLCIECIEIQIGSLSGEGYLFGAAFVPDENGEPTYRTFNGPITIERNGRWRAGLPIARFSGDLWKTTGGLCIECDENIEGSASASEEGQISITWHDNRNATLKWAGKTIEIAHWQWADNIGVDHSDWILGTWKINGDTFFEGVSAEVAAFGPGATLRSRISSVAKITKVTTLPAALQGNGWSAYKVRTMTTPVRSGQDRPNHGGGDFNLTEYIVFKPELGTWEIYHKNAVQPGAGLDTAAYPVIRLFVTDQDRMVGLGSHDGVGAQPQDIIELNTRLMTRIDSSWQIGDLYLPVASRAFDCE